MGMFQLNQPASLVIEIKIFLDEINDFLRVSVVIEHNVWPMILEVNG